MNLNNMMYNCVMGENFRRKRVDAKIGPIEKKYGVDFGVRSDKKLGQFLKENGFPSLSKALEKANKIQKKQDK